MNEKEFNELTKEISIRFGVDVEIVKVVLVKMGAFPGKLDKKTNEKK